MYNRKYILGCIFLIILFSILPIVSSVSPFLTGNTQGGCEIVPIIRDVIKINQGFDFNFHVFNQTNGFPLSNSSISCYFHLYNQTGDHTTTIQLRNDPFLEHLVTNEFVARLTGGNFSSLGHYAYQVQCNGTAVLGGCGEKGLFIVTNSGYDATTSRAIFDIGLLLILVIFLIGCVVLFMENNHLLAKVGFLGLGYLLLIAITFISWQMSSDFLLSAPFLIEMFRILFFVLIIGAFPLLIGAFAWYIIMMFQIKEIQRLMDKGFSMDDANRRVRHGK